MLPASPNYSLGQHVAEVVTLVKDVAIVLGVWRRSVEESALPRAKARRTYV